MESNWNKIKDIISRRECFSTELPDTIFKWLKKACTKARKKRIKANKTLLGHIKEEYFITEISENFKSFILKDCLQHEIIKNKSKDITILSEDRPFYIDTLWVNYQKKYEFNPPHTHSGIYSFVIFIKIPYDLKKEENYFKDIHEDQYSYNHTSKFAFSNIDYKGEIYTDCLDVDKSFEGKMLLFSSKQTHQVFPFYTSNDYRITVSGNVRLKV